MEMKISKEYMKQWHTPKFSKCATKQIDMLVIKDKKLEASYDYFTRNGKGSFNFDLYARLLTAKGINPNDKLEVITRVKNIKTK